MKLHSPSIDNKEIEKFTLLANEWWDENGKFKALHDLNPLRIEYIRDIIIEHFSIKSDSLPFKNLNFIDIGCGGGILTVPLGRLGANILGIDITEENIKVANSYKHKQNLSKNITFRHTSVEGLKDQPAKFDVVLAMEVVEHVANVESFLKSCATILKPGGIVFLSTINKTLKSYFTAILGAEYLLRLVPVGTHTWEKFLSPSEVYNIMNKHNLHVKDITGVKYNPLLRNWHYSNNTSVNYMLYAVKS